MSTTIVVPARYASTRFPAKPLALLRGATGIAKPLIQRSWEAACRAACGRRVVIATDDERIALAAASFGAEVVMTPESCANGTERCAAALPALADETRIIVNFQGDAPLTPAAFVAALIDTIEHDSAVAVATPALHAPPALHRRLLDEQARGQVGGTTVVRSDRGDALYFSKAVIPHTRSEQVGDPDLPIFFHVGVYAYRRDALLDYAGSPASRLEELEGLEQLRFLARGVPVRLIEVNHGDEEIWELNNPGDVPLIEAELARRGIA